MITSSQRRCRVIFCYLIEGERSGEWLGESSSMPVSANTPWIVSDPDETAGKLRRSQLAARLIQERMLEQQAQASHVEVRAAAGGLLMRACLVAICSL